MSIITWIADSSSASSALQTSGIIVLMTLGEILYKNAKLLKLSLDAKSGRVIAKHSYIGIASFIFVDCLMIFGPIFSNKYSKSENIILTKSQIYLTVVSLNRKTYLKHYI